MAPVLPSKRRAAEAKASRLEKPTSFFSSSESFPTNKADKRRMKHSTFVSRIEKSKAGSKSKKSRRPSKKLVTTLESLAGALPDAGELESGDVEVGNARIKQKSLKSRPGALKKKAKLEAVESERFRRNLAQMAKGRNTEAENAVVETGDGNSATTQQPQPKGTSARWAALRSFISTTMDKNDPA